MLYASDPQAIPQAPMLLLIATLCLCVIALLGKLVASWHRRHSRRKAWEAQRYPSFSPPTSDFNLGE